MTKIDSLKASFNAGELSPRLHARLDFVKYPAGLEECLNLIPLPEGGVTRRPGTRFVAETADSTKRARLFSFEATAEQHHILELGDNQVRFYFRQGQQFVLDTDAVVTNGLFPSDISDWDDKSTGGAGNQISHDSSNGRLTLETSGVAADDIGWAEQDVTTTDTDQETVIKFEVIGDPGDKIEFQVGSTSTGSETLGPVEKLVGYHCVAFTPTSSPFYIQFRNLGINADKNIQIDNVSIIDNSALEIDSPYSEGFLSQIMGAQSNDVKYLFRSAIAPYKLERRALASWSLVRVAWKDGPYIVQNSEATTLTPAATSGVAVTVTASSTIGINGGIGFLTTDIGRLIRIDNGSAWGWGIIVGVTTTTSISVHVKKAFAATSATVDWRLGAWSDTTGWPKTGGFFEQRLYVASTDDQSQTLWASQTSDFENFKPDDDNNVVEDDDALDFTLSADSVGEIRWLSAGEDTLAIGTAGGEWVPSASGIVITPLDITIRRQTTHGSALIAPLRIDHVVLFVQKAKRKVREFVFNFEFDSFLAPDITRLAQHITAPSIGEMAFQQEPDSLVWVVRGDGKLLSLTFRRDEDVVGWAKHDMGGSVITGSTTSTQASFTVTGGSSGGLITSVTIDGVEALIAPVPWDTDAVTTTVALLDAILNPPVAARPTLGGYTGGIGPGHPVGPEGIGSVDLEFDSWNGGFRDPVIGDVLLAWVTTKGLDAATFQKDMGIIPPVGWTQIFHTVMLQEGFAAASNVTYLWYKFFEEGDADKVHTFTADDNTLALFANESYIGNLESEIFGVIPAASNSRVIDITPNQALTNADLTFIVTNPLMMCFITSDHFVLWENDFQPPTATFADGWVRKTADDGGVPRDFHALFTNSTKTGVTTTGIWEWSNEIARNATVHMVVFATAAAPFVPGDYDITQDDATITITKLTAPFGGSGSEGDPGEIVVTTSGDIMVNVDAFVEAVVLTGEPLSESVVSISGFDGVGQVQNSEDRDEVWVTVKRTINGETKRYVEFLEGYYDNLLHDQEDAYYADSIITYDGILTDTITGLGHLEGETVKVWGDGAVLPDVVVTNGQIVLSTSVEVAQIGLPYTHRLKTLKIEGGNPSGTALGKKKRINSITFVLLNSHTLAFGPNSDNLFETDFRLVSDPMDAGAPLFTGEQFREFDGGLAADTRIIVESDDPAPFTLLAMVPEVKVNPSK